MNEKRIIQDIENYIMQSIKDYQEENNSGIIWQGIKLTEEEKKQNQAVINELQSILTFIEDSAWTWDI